VALTLAAAAAGILLGAGEPRAVTATLGDANGPTSLASSEGKLWVGVDASAGAHRGGTLVMVTTQRFASVDPVFHNVASNPQFIGLAYDTLLTFEHSGGGDGVRLVPDVALSIPTPTHGGSSEKAYAPSSRPRSVVPWNEVCSSALRVVLVGFASAAALIFA
jgi:hypothetical protein